MSTMGPMHASMPWHDGGLFLGMHWLWWLFWLVVLAVLFLALWRVVADGSRERHGLASEERAEEALRRRFAAGEIGEEEYVRKMRVLRETVV